MTSKSVIYTASCVCHPEDGVRYVGQTIKGLTARKGVHFWNARKEGNRNYHSHFSNWIRKHGEDNVSFEVLEQCEESELDARELHWISKLRQEGAKLTNIRPGGASERGYKRPRQSEAMRGSRNPMYGTDRREVMAYARSFNKPMTAANREAVSKRSLGELNVKAKLTEEQVREIRAEAQYYGVSAALAREYGVSAAMISAIRLRRSWKHVE